MRALCSLSLCVVLAGCASSGGARGHAAQPVHHVVLIKLLDPAAADELIAACRQGLQVIPGIAACHIGRPLDIARPTVAGDWDVGLVMDFASTADYRSYLDHPLHVELVAAWKPRWERITISDILQEPPAAR